MPLMVAIAVVATVTATLTLIGTMIAYHVEANDARRDRAIARMRAEHLRRRAI